MRFTGWPGTRASPRPWPKGAVRAPSQAGWRAGPGHAGEGQATHSRPDPARRSGSLAHAGQRAADDDPADHRGHGCQRRAHPYRRVWHLRPPACLGVSAQNGLPRARRIRPRRGGRRVLRGARQHDRGVLVPAALLAPPAPGDLAGEAAALSGVLPVRAQRTPSRQSPPRRARCRLGRMTHPTNTPEANKSLRRLPAALVQNCYPGLGQRHGGAYRATPSFSGCPMPYKANEARRHKIPRARYKVRNWPEYDRALQQRGSLTVWVTPEALAAWHPPRTGQRGRPRDYSDVAIETGHLLRLAFGRPWR